MRSGCGQPGQVQILVDRFRQSSRRLLRSPVPRLLLGPRPSIAVSRSDLPPAASSATLPGPQARLHRTAARSLLWAQVHKRPLVLSAALGLVGFAMTAVAVAPLVADPAALPRQVVVEEVQPTGLASQIEALADQDLSLWRSDVTRGIDTAETLLARLGVRDAAVSAFLRSDAAARRILAGRGGKMVQVRTTADGRLLELVARFPADGADQARTHFNRISLTKLDGRWLSSLQTLPYGHRLRLASSTITHSLFAAIDAAGLPDSVGAQLAEIFDADIDFHRDLRKGDRFSLVYEVLTADGEPVVWNEGVGRVVAAEFVNGSRTHQAQWFVGADGRGAYYGPNGESRRRAFLASPVAFSRVTSGFAMRMHPVLQTMRQHKGVDYAAPVGTEVRTVGDGVVEFAGVQRGYGKMVQIRHAGERSTLYAHLSSIAVAKGQRVQQGQHIGAVGMTGITTGPHLHFEFLVKGQHLDPVLVARSAETQALDRASLPAFLTAAVEVRAQLDAAQAMAVGARLRFE